MPTVLPPALVLGALHGATEMLPISSSGHVALAQLLASASARASAGGGRDAFEGGVPATTWLHAGTLAATIVVARRRAWAALEEGVRGLSRPSIWRETRGGQDAVTMALATLPTAVIGLTLGARTEAWATSPTVIGAGLVASALVVGSTALAPRGDRDTIPYWAALLVGVTQGAAIIPGYSRMGLVLAALTWLGLRPARVFELALLVSIPAVAGALLLRGLAAFGMLPHVTVLAGALPGARGAFSRPLGDGVDLLAVLAGAMLAFGVGVLALLALRRVLVGGKLALFAVYLVPLAVATLAWGYARP
jgi:undecaprenyl-diphosphatase